MVNLEHVVVWVFLNVICKIIQLCIVLYCMYKHVFIMNKMRTFYMEYLQPTITNHSALLSERHSLEKVLADKTFI